MLKHNFADVNGVRLHYASEGSGPLLMFLHGFPEFWYEWRDLLPDFARDHLAVAPDMRGYNLSSRPAEVEQYHMRALVEDVRALAAHLGYSRFTLAAHDWGGAVAWAFALAHPDMLDHLIIINSPHPATFRRELSTNPSQQKASEYMQFFRTPEAEERLSANNYALLRRILFGGSFIRSEADARAYVNAWSQPGALTGGLNYYRAMRGTGGPNAASADPAALVVKVPTLVIWGEKDTALLTSLLDGLEQFVPNLTVKRFPEGSHWVIHEQPQKVIASIREFIAKP
jgi:pimeloyl-ACP methyl ester carboxylesterase